MGTGGGPGPGTNCGTQGSEPKVTEGGGSKATGQFHLVSHERGNYFRFRNRETRDTVLIKTSDGRVSVSISYYILPSSNFRVLKTTTQTILELILL